MTLRRPFEAPCLKILETKGRVGVRVGVEVVVAIAVLIAVVVVVVVIAVTFFGPSPLNPKP